MNLKLSLSDPEAAWTSSPPVNESIPFDQVSFSASPRCNSPSARPTAWGQKVLLHYWTAWTDACPFGLSEAIRRAAEWSCRSIYSCCHYSRPSAKTLLDYRNGAEQVKGPLRPIRSEWPRADGPRMCLQYLLVGGTAACWACRAL